MTKEYIEREALMRKYCPMRHKNGNCLPCGGFCTSVNDPICEAIHNAYRMGKNAADVVEVRHGRFVDEVGNWIESFDYCGRACDTQGRALYRPIYCSECHICLAGMNDKLYPHQRNYCPNCGAKMDGKSEE